MALKEVTEMMRTAYGKKERVCPAFSGLVVSLSWQSLIRRQMDRQKWGLLSAGPIIPKHRVARQCRLDRQ